MLKFTHSIGEIMLSIYDLYDLSAIFKNIRSFPNYDRNREVIAQVVDVLSNRCNNYEDNIFRHALRLITNLDQDIYFFVYTENYYVFYPRYLKQGMAFSTLLKTCQYLLKTIEQGNINMTQDLADCLHNLPIYIANNNMVIPKAYWRQEVKWFRQKWDPLFLNDCISNDIITQHSHLSCR